MPSLVWLQKMAPTGFAIFASPLPIYEAARFKVDAQNREQELRQEATALQATAAALRNQVAEGVKSRGNESLTIRGERVGPPPFLDPSIVPPPPFTVEELGPWAHHPRMFNPQTNPLWLQEQSLTDLGLPVNGSDGIFLQMANTNGWTGDFPPMPEAW